MAAASTSSIPEDEVPFAHPIHEAAFTNDQAGIVKWLDEDRTLIDVLDTRGCSPILCAAAGGHHDLVQWLIEMKSMCIDTPDCNGMTPMHVAAMKGHCRVMRTLVKNGSKALTMQDNAGRAPLHVATFLKQKHAFLVALDCAPNVVKTRTCAGYLPVHVAAEVGNVFALKRLVKRGPKATLNDNGTPTGETPLHIAVRTRMNRCVQVLLLNGGHLSTTMRDRVGLRPITYALSSGDVHLIGMLVKHSETDVQALIAGPNTFILRHKVL